MSKVDLVVHHRNSKTGRVTHTTPYRLHVVNGVHKYERPPGSGKFYAANGEPMFKEQEEETAQLNVDKEVAEIVAVSPVVAAAPKAATAQAKPSQDKK